jgi:rSAM/selenodomain-associated transferase 2
MIMGDGARRAGPGGAVPRLSVVIPVRNDADALRRTLDRLDELPGRDGIEVIVAAADSLDATARTVGDRAALLVPGVSTRAGLMNAGAAVARGHILWFLHADSLPPLGAPVLIARAMADERVVGGAFAHRFTERSRSLALISFINRIRYWLTRNYYGDQGLFVRAVAFHQLGGYPDLALMEDLILSQALKRLGRTALIRTPLFTSGRRFLARGPWHTFGVIVWLLLLHTLGRDTQRYAARWRGPADRTPGSAWTAPTPRP